ncbi:hypothetical protein JG688_00000559 [Phytophthora aleatoria]|uniref:Uncharacterized protein n=1 Tax=Phytophthora aleatoria TaxID=2496075 RepID=A0A8J5JHB6_9STRA|nr:hypothetical protein JG688_00000559 [Phytophthora aleatoria]
MEEVRSSARSTDSIVVAPEHHDTWHNTPPLAVASALPLPLASIKKPHKLTPLEKKERDRLRMKEQSQRRKQAIKDQYDQAKRFAQQKRSSASWHQQERLEEELVLRRLERDVVEPQRSHPAAAGYYFDDTAQKSSPVFASYSYALCPPSQASRFQLQSRSGLQKTTNLPTEAEYLHPACHGYAMAKHDDSSCISPVFFFKGFAKIPLDKIVMKQDDDTDDSDMEDSDVGRTVLDEMDGNRELSEAAKFRMQESKRRLEVVMAARELYSKPLDIAAKDCRSPKTSPMCLVCKKIIVTAGCPGCFSFSSKKYLVIEASKATQRLKTPKTTFQEEEDVRARHKALQRQIIIPPLLPRLHSSLTDVDPLQNTTSTSQDDENNFYSSVLPDFRAIRKFRALASKFITLHIKSLPVGQLISLTVDLRSSVSYLYELYRANTELPNRPLHLLLPTTHGLFYLDEHIASATYTRNGVVNGELLLEDFNLQKTAPPRSDRADAVGDNNNNSEFLLFAVAILHPQSTPQLVLNYVQQNFHFKPPENRALSPLVISVDSKDNGGLPQWTRLVPATFLLPKAVDQDPFQVQIRPHIHAMHVFAKTNYAIIAAEQREERERLLLLAHQEAKAAKLALKKKLRGQQTSTVSIKVRRALTYFEFICESTSNPRQPRVAEERLGKLWQFMQMLEEWKILKGGRLLDIERSDATMSLMQQLKETASVAFNQMMFGTKTLKGGGTLPYPVLCLEGSGTTRKLVLRLGTRMGVTQQDDHDYGMVLNVDQDFEALEKEEPKRGYMKRVAADQETQDEQMVEAWDDAEWRNKGRSSSTMALLVSSSDLLSPPFHRIKWPLIVKAYKLVLKHVALVSSKLDEFNSLARELQTPDAVLSKAQLMKWQADVDHFLATLHENCALARAVQRVLCKKGVAVLKRRAQARRKQLRDREKELERLRELQLERDRPKLTLAQQLKVAFMKERAPQLREAVELTPAEKLGAKAGELLGKAASGVVKAARQAKKEYTVRTL